MNVTAIMRVALYAYAATTASYARRRRVKLSSLRIMARTLQRALPPPTCAVPTLLGP